MRAQIVAAFETDVVDDLGVVEVAGEKVDGNLEVPPVAAEIGKVLDLDLVLHLAPDNVRRAIRALEGLGYRPMIPVDAAEFANPERRREWI